VQGFVTLQKWDHHGAYDLKLLIEKTQRKLATCNKRTASAASELITPVFSSSAASVGIDLVNSLAAPLAEQSLRADDAEPPSKVASISTTSSNLPRPVQTSLSTLALWNRMEAVPAVVEAWITSSCSALQQRAAAFLYSKTFIRPLEWLDVSLCAVFAVSRC
jgi:hypothetical protein